MAQHDARGRHAHLENLTDEQMKRIEAITEEAKHKFWDYVALQIPEAKSGDLSCGLRDQLDVATEDAIAEWFQFNVIDV